MTVAIRPAGSGDYTAYTRLFGELGLDDPVPLPARFAEVQMPMMRVACAGPDVIGYVTWRPYGDVALVVQLVVDPEHRGQRVGEQLLRFAADEARVAGCRRWCLYVKRENTSALRLYARCGLALELEAWALKIAWQHVPHVDVVDALLAPEEDVAVAARFGLPVERLANFRGRKMKLVTLRDGSEVTALAPFDPGFPGTPVFAAARPELAGGLLEALRRHGDPRFDFVRVTVEGDRPLADAVMALGAELTFELLRLSAPL